MQKSYLLYAVLRLVQLPLAFLALPIYFAVHDNPT